MREQKDIIRYEAYIIGEDNSIIPIKAFKETYNKYYTIKNLNFKGNIMDLFDYQAQMCTSAKDIHIFKYILDEADKHNIFNKNADYMLNNYNIVKSRLYTILAKGVKCGFLRKSSRGIYLINPFAFKAKGATNQHAEEAQLKWNSIVE